MNTEVNLKLAKLLKEKEFDKRSEKRYGTQSGILYNDALINDVEDNVFTAAPTIAEVAIWLYEKHGIWIWVSCKEVEDGSGNILFVANGRRIPFEKHEGFVKDCIIYNPKKSPTEAYEFAIEYCLTKLI